MTEHFRGLKQAQIKRLDLPRHFLFRNVKIDLVQIQFEPGVVPTPEPRSIPFFVAEATFPCLAPGDPVIPGMQCVVPRNRYVWNPDHTFPPEFVVSVRHPNIPSLPVLARV